MKLFRPVTLALVAIPLALATACGSSSTPQVASVGSGGPAPSASPGRSALAFAKCMRSKGVDVDDQGNLPKAANGTTPLPANFMAANTACERFAPQQVVGGSNSDAQNTNMKLATCMRKNGVTDWPDPVAGDAQPASGSGGGMVTAGGGGTSSFQLPASINLASPKVKKALQKCQGGSGSSISSSSGITQ